jgi:hypothetical protein
MSATDPSLWQRLASRLRALLSTRGGRALLAAFAVAGLVAAFLPLADHLGFELALLLCIVSALVAPAVGVAAMRLELRRPEDERRPVAAAIAAAVFSVAALLIPAALILLNGLRRPVCDATGGAVWLAVISAPTAFLAAPLGALTRLRTGTATRAGVLVGVVELASLLVGLRTIYSGPAFFLYDHFFGYYPGPLYDETVLLSSTVLVFRAMTVLWGLAAILACAIGDPEPRHARAGRLAAAILTGVLVATSLGYGEAIGFRTTDGSLAAALGAEKRVDDLELHYPKEWSERQVDELVRDATFRASQVEAALGVKPTSPVRVWMYRSADEKRRLTGAASTSFAKPWRREIHVHASGFPHSVLRHELVHAFAADVGTGLFKVPGGLVPNSPLIEGFAVAFDTDPEGMTLAQWAKAMRDLKLAPDIAGLLSTEGFYDAAPSRAYTYAGAFLRFLNATYGREKVLAVYASGNLSQLGDPKTIVAAFEASLDALTIAPDEKAAAERRFSRPSVFHRKCAREVSQVTEDARELLAHNEPTRALERFADACEMEPDDPALLRNVLTAAIRGKNEAKRDATAAALFAHPKLDASLHASALVELGDDAWSRGNLTTAEAHYREAAALNVDAATHRSALVKSRAVADPGHAALLKGLLVDGNAEIGRLFALNDALVAQPDDALVAYLLGRQLVQRNAQPRGIPLLERVADIGLDDRELMRENSRLLVRAHAERHECDAAHGARHALQEVSGAASDDLYAADWEARCRFEVARGWAPFE